MGKWKGPIGEIILISYILAMGIFVIFAFLTKGLSEDAVEFLVPIIMSFLTTAIILRLFAREVKDFIIKGYDMPIHRLLPRLEEALVARGVPFTSRDRSERPPFSIKFDEVLDLNRGEACIALKGELGTTRVYLGPVEPDNGVVIERLKGLIDGAVG